MSIWMYQFNLLLPALKLKKIQVLPEILLFFNYQKSTCLFYKNIEKRPKLIYNQFIIKKDVKNEKKFKTDNY